ncbi:uncharacterized protein LOC115078862 [Rhinatrema bivittatum]|uniref:uncharacterized protein LOC115078862 n=1 Tax=Rhinatrema bivittatum TaxID=194408 RepID=UPI0011285DC0|nr:uncharacterized protein LOC115078862 [Rhinatrema bivittatum]XP_029437778.1 uncharacterized protein LOC115078862 [Rhinatrema bivittatum]XP_029437779.1 uncharacterized protein LOC115078862 [Rhinatrema bivittatum]
MPSAISEPTLTTTGTPEPLVRPTVVTLENLWELSAGLTLAVRDCNAKLDTFASQINTKILAQDNTLTQLQTAVGKVDTEISKIKEFNMATIQDRAALSRRLELLENWNRRLNLRLINFPRVMGEMPISTLKRYFAEVLLLPENQFPSINKAYFILQNRSNQQAVPPMDLQNLTDFLESSAIEIIDFSTLLVSLIMEQDVSRLMIAYFKNLNTLFHGKKVRMFPDISKITQERRKGFLSLRQDVISLGATFLLRYPCKCIIKKEANTFIFFFPRTAKAIFRFSYPLREYCIFRGIKEKQPPLQVKSY